MAKLRVEKNNLKTENKLQPFEAIYKNALNLQLIPISMRELFYLSNSSCDIYGLNEGLFSVLLKKKSKLDNYILKKLIRQKKTKLFVKEEDYQELILIQQENLRKATRSLSIGNHIENCNKQLNLLSINMSYLYENPTDDNQLKLQFQSTKTLASFLLTHPEIHPKIFEKYIQQKHHYIFAQPMLSSIFLLGALKQSHIFADKDIEKLFITSYFKDIGMSLIPINKYDQEDLSESDKRLLSNHAETSVEILSGRINISDSNLKIIRNHHAFGILESKNSKQGNDDPNKFLTGFETMIVSVMDIIAAMISERPYRKSCNLYNALELTKILISDQYPREFKVLVHYFKQFFKKPISTH